MKGGSIQLKYNTLQILRFWWDTWGWNCITMWGWPSDARFCYALLSRLRRSCLGSSYLQYQPISRGNISTWYLQNLASEAQSRLVLKWNFGHNRYSDKFGRNYKKQLKDRLRKIQDKKDFTMYHFTVPLWKKITSGFDYLVDPCSSTSNCDDASSLANNAPASVDTETSARAIEQRRFLMTELLETEATYIADLEQCYAYIKQVLWRMSNNWQIPWLHDSYLQKFSSDSCARARRRQNLISPCLKISGTGKIGWYLATSRIFWIGIEISSPSKRIISIFILKKVNIEIALISATLSELWQTLLKWVRCLRRLNGGSRCMTFIVKISTGQNSSCLSTSTLILRYVYFMLIRITCLWEQFVIIFQEIRQKLPKTERNRKQLPDLLIAPIQRVTKYKLLLEGILKYSQRAGLKDEAESIAKALHVMTLVLTQTNEMMDIGKLDGFEVRSMKTFCSAKRNTYIWHDIQGMSI